MKLGHVAMWTTQIEVLKSFYVTYFGATSGERYVNPRTNFSSYFLAFDGDAALELMQTSGIQIRAYNPEVKAVGLTHLAFTLNTKDEVDTLTQRLQQDRYALEKAPRMTGDGFYESAVFDPDGNIVEITCLP